MNPSPLPHPSSAVLGAIKAALNNCDYDRFLSLESWFHSNIVKAIENQSHHETCFNEFESLSIRYGNVLRDQIKLNHTTPKMSRRVCYLLPNIDNDLAHVEFLYNVLKHHPPNSDIRIVIAGYFASNVNTRPASRYLSQLATEGRVELQKFADNHQGRLTLLNFLLSKNFSQLIVYSVPLNLASWVRALGPELVTWVTSKFELNAFSELTNRVSFAGDGTGRYSSCNGWIRTPLTLNRSAITSFEAPGRPRTRLISINRAEKIRTEEFLSAICRILRSESDTTFAWTGRRLDPGIQERFEREGLSGRCDFIGWVDPHSTFHRYDIFLDCFGLSGLVAATAFASGMPTVFFKGSRSFVEFYEKRLLCCDLPSESVLATTIESYVKNVVSLIRDPSKYEERSKAQKKFSAIVFFDETLMYDAHVQIVRTLIR